MAIEEGLYAYLKTRVGLVQDRVYFSLADIKAAQPTIVIEMRDRTPVMHMGGAVGLTQGVMVLSVWADKKSTVKTIAELVRLVMSGYRGNMGTEHIRACFFGEDSDVTFESPDVEGLRMFGVQMDATIWYVETRPSFT